MILKIIMKNYFYIAIHYQLKVHDKNNDESLFIIIKRLKILDSNKTNNTLNIIQQAIHTEN